MADSGSRLPTAQAKAEKNVRDAAAAGANIILIQVRTEVRTVFMRRAWASRRESQPGVSPLAGAVRGALLLSGAIGQVL